MSSILISLLERFWSKVDKTAIGDCWLWTGGVTSNGYGGFFLQGKSVRPHRFSLMLSVGPSPEGKPYALHSCRNKLCVNSEHLSWGSASDNNGRDRCRDGTLPTGKRSGKYTKPEKTPRGEKNGMCKFSDEVVRKVYLAKGTCREIGILFGMDRSWVADIKRRHKRQCATEGLL